MIIRPWKRIRDLEERVRELEERERIQAEALSACASATHELRERVAEAEQMRHKALADLDAARKAESDAQQALRAEREAHAATAARHGVAETLRQAAEARANELLQEILALKRDGFHPPEPPPPAPPPAEDLPAEVRDALAEVARPGSDVWYSELALAQADLAAGKQPAEVAQAILRGGKYRPW